MTVTSASDDVEHWASLVICVDYSRSKNGVVTSDKKSFDKNKNKSLNNL